MKELSNSTKWFLSFVSDPALLDDSNFQQQAARQIDEAQGDKIQLTQLLGPAAIEAATEAFQENFEKVFSSPENFISEMQKASQEYKDSFKNQLPINPLLKYYQDPANIAKDMKDLGLNISFKQDILTFAGILQQRGPGVYNAAKQNIDFLLSKATGVKPTGGDTPPPTPKKEEKINPVFIILGFIIIIFAIK